MAQTDYFATTLLLTTVAPAWLLGWLGLGLLAPFAFVCVAYYCIYYRRLRMKRLELVAERNFRRRCAKTRNFTTARTVTPT